MLVAPEPFAGLSLLGLAQSRRRRGLVGFSRRQEAVGSLGLGWMVLLALNEGLVPSQVRECYLRLVG